MQDVGGDAAGAPFAVDCGRGAVDLDGDVVRMDLGPNAVEQDATLPPDRTCRGGRMATPEQELRERLDDRPAVLAANLLAAVGDVKRCGQDGFRVLGGTAATEEGGEHRPPRLRVRRFAIHDGPGEKALLIRRVGEEGGRPRNEGVCLDPSVDNGPGVWRRILESHGRSSTADRTICGNVDSQSIAR